MSQQAVLLARHADPQPGLQATPAQQSTQAEGALQAVQGPQMVAGRRSGRPDAAGDLLRSDGTGARRGREQALRPPEGEQAQAESDGRDAKPGLGESRPVGEPAGTFFPAERKDAHRSYYEQNREPDRPNQPNQIDSAELRFHWIFGLRLGSELPFRSHFGAGQAEDGPADLVVSCERLPLVLPEPSVCVYRSRSRTSDGEPTFSLHRSADHEILRFTGVADFHLGPDRIVARPATPEPGPLLEIHLLGPVLSYWLERRGVVTLHSSAVALGRRATAFFATHGGGKSGVAASLIQAGHPLLSDDLLPIEEAGGGFLARPGYPQMRMWPDEATHFLGGFEHLPPVHLGESKRRVPVGGSGDSGGFGAFHDSPLPLACLYLLDRRPENDAPIEIREVSPRDAMIELLRHSFTPLLVEAAGLQPARLDFLSRLVMQVPVRRLRYPSGFERLPAVAEAIRRDLDRC